MNEKGSSFIKSLRHLPLEKVVVEISRSGTGELDWSTWDDTKQGHKRVQPGFLATG